MSPATGSKEAQDKELVQRARAGDVEAFHILVEKYLSAVVSVAYYYLGEVNAAQDVAQEAFLEAHRGLAGLRDPAKFGRFVYGIGRLRAIYQLKRRKRGQAALQTRAEEERRRVVDTPLETALRRERCDGIRKALSEIPERYSEVLVLKYVDNRSYEEIGQILGLSLAAVDKRLLRGKEMLRESLSRLLEER